MGNCCLPLADNSDAAAYGSHAEKRQLLAPAPRILSHAQHQNLHVCRCGEVAAASNFTNAATYRCMATQADLMHVICLQRSVNGKEVGECARLDDYLQPYLEGICSASNSSVTYYGYVACDGCLDPALRTFFAPHPQGWLDADTRPYELLSTLTQHLK